MNINIKATGIELTPDLSDYVHKKVGSLEKYFSKKSSDIVVQVEVAKSTEHHRTGDVYRAEVHVSGDGLDLYAGSEESDIFAAIDVVKDEITREARRTIDKESTLARRGGAIIKNMAKGFSWSVERFNPKNFRKK
ncbi:MAG: ribosome-associated translation inhibitor RaiA [Parcubacteria group bacterium]